MRGHTQFFNSNSERAKWNRIPSTLSLPSSLNISAIGGRRTKEDKDVWWCLAPKKRLKPLWSDRGIIRKLGTFFCPFVNYFRQAVRRWLNMLSGRQRKVCVTGRNKIWENKNFSVQIPLGLGEAGKVGKRPDLLALAREECCHHVEPTLVDAGVEPSSLVPSRPNHCKQGPERTRKELHRNRQTEE